MFEIRTEGLLPDEVRFAVYFNGEYLFRCTPQQAVQLHDAIEELGTIPENLVLMKPRTPQADGSGD